MTARMVLRSAQLLELELVLAGAWGKRPRFCSPAESGARLVAGAPVALGETLALIDTEGTEVAKLSVTDAGRTAASRWVAGKLDPCSALGHRDFAELRVTQPRQPDEQLISSHAVVITGEVPSADDARWRDVAVDVSIVVLDYGDTAALARHVEAVRALGRPVAVMPAPDAGARALDEWLESVESCARALVSDHVTLWRTDHARGHGIVILLSGLSGSGKSTIAKRLAERLSVEDSRRVSLLDGDEVRLVLSAGLGFSREDRLLNVHRIGWVAALVSEHGGTAICAPIAPYAEMRSDMRAQAERVGDFMLVHVSTPLEVCERRDRKGLYAKARRGEIAQFTGISDPYEEPTDADLSIDTSIVEVDDAVNMIVAAVRARGKAAEPAYVAEYMI